MALTHDLRPTMNAPLRSMWPMSIGDAPVPLTFNTAALISPLAALAVKTAMVSMMFFRSSSLAASSSSMTAMFRSRSRSNLGGGGFASGSKCCVPSFRMYNLPVTAPLRTASSARTGLTTLSISRCRANKDSQSASSCPCTHLRVSAATCCNFSVSEASRLRLLARSGSRLSSISLHFCAIPYRPIICPARSVNSFRFASNSAVVAVMFWPSHLEVCFAPSRRRSLSTAAKALKSPSSNMPK
mmetsp:Transcript_10165/g.26150  ORF Transcript_10165/g.26150 Transcript_10165/m.26150 type:complete len:242 (-) Transcript_10165:115-840(-)